jgi:hypothetical protein
MANFGETLFGESPFLRWTLSPFVLLFAALMPFLIPAWTPASVAIALGMELICLALLAGFWLPARFGHSGFRLLAGLVFLAYSAYLIFEFFFSTAPFKLIQARSETSPRNALMGFVIIGLPCLWYAIFGRFKTRPTAEQM